MSRSRLRWLIPSVLLTVFALAGLTGLVIFRTDLFLARLAHGPLTSESAVDAWVEQIAQGHGTRAAWLAQGEVEPVVRGELAFFPVRLVFGLPISQSSVDLRLRFRPDTHGPYEYELRQGGEVRAGIADTRKDRDGLGLLFDSVRHLFELPWTAEVAPFRRGLAHHPEGLEGIFLTWAADPLPGRVYDQVALWRRGGRLVRMDTTGRDIAPFILARVDYSDEISLGALTLPRTVAVMNPEAGRLVMRWELMNVRASAAGF